MSIDTLVQDIYEKLEGGVSVSPSTELSSDKQDFRLRPSNLGEQCLRKLWYQKNTPEILKRIDGETNVKFFIGHVTEAVILEVIRQTSHEVSHEQFQTGMFGITGSIDCIIDGCLVDVKSASPYAFQKYKSGLSIDNDPFGYIYQTNFYLDSLQNEDALVNKDQPYLLAIEKSTGELALIKVPRLKVDWEKAIAEKGEALIRETPPKRAFSPEPSGKSGNMAVPNVCKWCPAVDTCWSGARKFLYSNGIVRLTQVVKEPNVTEVFE